MRPHYNETKNVIKTLIVGICNYILENQDQIKKVLHLNKISHELEKFKYYCRKLKSNVNTIKHLRRVWTAESKNYKVPEYRKCFRILSFKFLRKNFPAQIYESGRIKNKVAYLKCRAKIMEYLRFPDKLVNLKDY